MRLPVTNEAQGLAPPPMLRTLGDGARLAAAPARSAGAQFPPWQGGSCSEAAGELTAGRRTMWLLQALQGAEPAQQPSSSNTQRLRHVDTLQQPVCIGQNAAAPDGCTMMVPAEAGSPNTLHRQQHTSAPRPYGHASTSWSAWSELGETTAGQAGIDVAGAANGSAKASTVQRFAGAPTSRSMALGTSELVDQQSELQHAQQLEQQQGQQQQQQQQQPASNSHRPRQGSQPGTPERSTRASHPGTGIRMRSPVRVAAAGGSTRRRAALHKLAKQRLQLNPAEAQTDQQRQQEEQQDGSGAGARLVQQMEDIIARRQQTSTATAPGPQQQQQQQQRQQQQAQAVPGLEASISFGELDQEMVPQHVEAAAMLSKGIQPPAAAMPQVPAAAAAAAAAAADNTRPPGLARVDRSTMAQLPPAKVAHAAGSASAAAAAAEPPVQLVVRVVADAATATADTLATELQQQRGISTQSCDTHSQQPASGTAATTMAAQPASTANESSTDRKCASELAELILGALKDSGGVIPPAMPPGSLAAAAMPGQLTGLSAGKWSQQQQPQQQQQQQQQQCFVTPELAMPAASQSGPQFLAVEDLELHQAHQQQHHHQHAGWPSGTVHSASHRSAQLKRARAAFAAQSGQPSDQPGYVSWQTRSKVIRTHVHGADDTASDASSDVCPGCSYTACPHHQPAADAQLHSSIAPEGSYKHSQTFPTNRQLLSSTPKHVRHAMPTAAHSIHSELQHAQTVARLATARDAATANAAPATAGPDATAAAALAAADVAAGKQRQAAAALLAEERVRMQEALARANAAHHAAHVSAARRGAARSNRVRAELRDFAGMLSEVGSGFRVCK